MKANRKSPKDNVHLGPKWHSTKLAIIVMNKSRVVPLTATGIEIGDRQYIDIDITFWGKMGSKAMTIKDQYSLLHRTHPQTSLVL